MDIKILQQKFELINVRLFADRYELSYDHLWRVLKGKRDLTEKYAIEVHNALKKFKENL